MAHTGAHAVDPLFLSFQLALAGRYSIDRELGRGGMGVVYLAREVHLDRAVAIKVLPPERAADPERRNRFVRAARLAAKLSHPNIIPIHAVDDAGGFVFYVMAYIDGETLAHRVRTRGPLPGSEGTRILREAAWALAHAHAQGLVHRDVKPDNILLEASSGRVLVADFGIAAAVGEAAQGVSGTPEFMSPEQALGTHVDARSDLYGLGATGFFAFSGRLPFEGRSATEVLAKQVTEQAPKLGSLGLAVPRRVASLIDRCLAKDPAHRPESAEALAEQLGVALEQRRELPVALRAFVKRSGRLDGGGTIIGLATLLSGSIGMASIYGMTAGFSTLVLGATVVPLAYLVHGARRLSLLGFGHSDLAPAFKSELELAREEHAVDHARGASIAERALRQLSRLGLGVFGISAAFLGVGLVISETFTQWAMVNRLFEVVIFSFSAGFLANAGSLYLRQRREDVDTEFWANTWNGHIGKLAFAIGSKLLGSRVRGSAMTHRATELSLGMAAENLFETLPRETRAALGDLPGLLHRLQDDAQGLRRRYDALQEALAGAGDAVDTAAHASLRASRDALHDKLSTAVGALETIRLNLLRLHAGAGTVEGLTTHLDLAAEVSREVERLLAAHDEVARALAFPRDIATTPV